MNNLTEREYHLVLKALIELLRSPSNATDCVRERAETIALIQKIEQWEKVKK